VLANPQVSEGVGRQEKGGKEGGKEERKEGRMVSELGSDQGAGGNTSLNQDQKVHARCRSSSSELGQRKKRNLNFYIGKTILGIWASLKLSKGLQKKA